MLDLRQQSLHRESRALLCSAPGSYETRAAGVCRGSDQRLRQRPHSSHAFSGCPGLPATADADRATDDPLVQVVAKIAVVSSPAPCDRALSCAVRHWNLAKPSPGEKNLQPFLPSIVPTRTESLKAAAYSGPLQGFGPWPFPSAPGGGSQATGRRTALLASNKERGPGKARRFVGVFLLA